MFFSAYSGAGAGVPAWRATVMAHAADIGCAPAFVAHPIEELEPLTVAGKEDEVRHRSPHLVERL